MMTAVTTVGVERKGNKINHNNDKKEKGRGLYFARGVDHTIHSKIIIIYFTMFKIDWSVIFDNT